MFPESSSLFAACTYFLLLACAWWALTPPFCNEDAPSLEGSFRSPLLEASRAWPCPLALFVIREAYFVSHV